MNEIWGQQTVSQLNWDRLLKEFKCKRAHRN